MPLLIEQPISAQLLPSSFPRNYTYSREFESDYDRVVAISKRAKNNQVRIHRLVDDQGTHYGFIAISIGVLSRKPCLLIDYVFSSEQFRGVSYPELDGLTVAKFLLSYATKLAIDADRNYPIRYIALEPANDKLQDYYSTLGYRKLDSTQFMFLKIGSMEY